MTSGASGEARQVMAIVEDYSLTGPSSVAAREQGLADAEWWRPNIDPTLLRSLQVRTNGRATRDTLLWLGLIVASGVWAYTTVWSWWSVPAFAAYGALFGGASDSRWHECGHGTAFRNQAANEIVYYFACFGLLRGPTVWRWSHVRHHTDTIIVGRDYEIAFRRGMGVWRALYAFTGIPSTIALTGQLLRHSTGRIDADVATFLPHTDRRKVVWESRSFVAIVAAAIIASVVSLSPLPLLFVGLPTIYGAWLVVFFGITQHAGLTENVLDHRRNTRTVYMNPVFRFLYSNMNYHVEHHIFPTVPYGSLPGLHRAIGDQLAPALPTTLAAYRQVFSSLSRQADDADYEIPVSIPDVPTATKAHINVGDFAAAADGLVDLGPVDDLPVGELRPVTIGDAGYVLARPDDSTLCLVDELCTHQRVSLADGVLIDGQIECPKHNARFDCRTGQATRRPATVALGVYPVESVSGRILATVPKTPVEAVSPIDFGQLSNPSQESR